MERVLGIGGVFFRSARHEEIRDWYRDNLGIDVREWGGFSFQAADGDVTVWSIFEGGSDYWPRDQQAMVNYRVADLDAMLSQLRANGVEVKERVEDSEYGRFGWAFDPEGRLLELWQPPPGYPD